MLGTIHSYIFKCWCILYQQQQNVVKMRRKYVPTPKIFMNLRMANGRGKKPQQIHSNPTYLKGSNPDIFKTRKLGQPL